MKQKVLFVVCLLFGLMFINAGLNKFFNYMPTPEKLPQELLTVMEAFMTITWLMPLIAIAEIVGGVLVIIPKTRALGAIIIFPIMIGIVLMHVVSDPEGLPMALAFFAVNIWVIIEDRHKYAPMVQ